MSLTRRKVELRSINFALSTCIEAVCTATECQSATLMDNWILVHNARLTLTLLLAPSSCLVRAQHLRGREYSCVDLPRDGLGSASS